MITEGTKLDGAEDESEEAVGGIDKLGDKFSS